MCLHMFVHSFISYPASIFRFCLAVTLEVSISGQKVLAMAREAGADITDAASKCVASTSKQRYKEQDIHLVVNHSTPERAVKVLCTHSGESQGQ